MTKLTHSAALFVLTAVLALPSGTAGAVAARPAAANHARQQSPSTPAIVFGIRGGNIRPWSVTIQAGGAVTAQNINVSTARISLASDTIAAIKRFAHDEGFGHKSPFEQCTGVLPDIASEFVTIYSRTSSKTVQVHGHCDRAVNGIWALAYNTVGVHQ